MNKESGYIPPAGLSSRSVPGDAKADGQLGDYFVEEAKAPEAKQKESREASLDSKESLQSHSVEVVKFSGGLWPKVLGVSIPPVGVSSKVGSENIEESAKPSGGFWSKVIRVYDQTRALVTEKTGLITSHRVDLDGIILNASKDPARAAKVFSKWGRELQVAEQVGESDENLEQRFWLSILEKAGLVELDPATPGEVKAMTPENLLRLQLLTDSMEKLQQNPEFIKHLNDNPDTQRGFMSIKHNVTGPSFRFRIACTLCHVPPGDMDQLQEEGIPSRAVLAIPLLFRNDAVGDKHSIEIELRYDDDVVTIKGDVLGIYKRQMLPFAKDKESLTKVFDALEHIVYSDLEGEALIRDMPWSEHFKYLGDPLKPSSMLKESGNYPWEELGLLADTVQFYTGKPYPASSIALGIQKHLNHYFEHAEINFLVEKTKSGELLSALFLQHFSLDQLALMLPRDAFLSLEASVLNDFKGHEPYLDRVSIQKYLQPAVAHKLIFGTTLFDRERVGREVYPTTPSEAKFKAFCREVMDPDHYKELNGEVLDVTVREPLSLVDWMQELKPEAIVELFNRNGVWTNYTDEQIAKMLPEGIAMIDILDARDQV